MLSHLLVLAVLVVFRAVNGFVSLLSLSFLHFFFFNDTATTEIYTLSLHDALPICSAASARARSGRFTPSPRWSSRSPSTACSGARATPAAWRCASPASSAIGPTRAPPTPTPSTRSAASCRRPRRARDLRVRERSIDTGGDCDLSRHHGQPRALGDAGSPPRAGSARTDRPPGRRSGTGTKRLLHLARPQERRHARGVRRGGEPRDP